MKIITVLGARPQFIKAATISREIKTSHPELTEKILHTGQHFDKNMSDIFFSEMDIPKPDFQLNINNSGHGSMTGRMLIEIEKILISEMPNLVLVFGDTNSTLAGALAAKKLNIPVAHVEAGLRSFNMKMPEEVNRIITDRISDMLFCPTKNSIQNLLNEGYEQIGSKILNTGDVMYDAALYYGSKKSKNVNTYDNYVLSTIHRAENTDDQNRLINIIEALNEINNRTQVIVPLHPRTRNKINELKLSVQFKTLDPVGYLDMVDLIRNSKLVMTDSGGLQKEAFFFSKYCITLRDETEWVELTEGGFNQLVGANKEKILASFDNLINKEFNNTSTPYGDGKAAKIIVSELKKFLNEK